MGMAESEKNRIGEIKGFPGNILIRSSRSFSRGRSIPWWGGMDQAIAIRQVGKSAFAWLFCPVSRWKGVRRIVTWGISVLQKLIFQNRFALSRISCVKRWRLEPRDPEAYARENWWSP